MSSSAYGQKLNPYRRLREPLGAKGSRQTIVVSNNPSTIGQKQQLLVRFPNLGAHDVIVPGSVRLAFNVALTSTDANATVVQNLGRALVRKLTVRLSSNEVFSLEDSDVFHTYLDLWWTRQARANAVYQGIDTSADMNVTLLRVGADDAVATRAADAAIAKAYKDRYSIPLDLELLETHAPFYQSALGDRLEVEFTFNDASRVVRSTDAASTYSLENISLEYDVVTEPGLARIIRGMYASRMAILYERVLRHRRIPHKKEDSIWNINLNTPCRSLKGLLLLWVDPTADDKAFGRNSENYYNPKITKVEVIVEGQANQLFAHGLQPHQLWEEARKFTAGGPKRHPEVNAVAKELGLADVSLGEYLTTKFCLWLDFRTSDDDQLHGSGCPVENASEGVTLQITKEAETAGPLHCYVFLVMDGQLNIEADRFVTAVY